MRTLIYCMSHVNHERVGRLLRTWQKLTARLNPEADILVVESASPLGIEPWLEGTWDIVPLTHDDDTPLIRRKFTVAAFGNALGHPFYDGVKQGAGSDRAWAKGLEMAIKAQYDRLVYYEYDLLSVIPVARIFERMTKKAACGPLVDHGKYPETGLFYTTPAFVDSIDLVGKYNWRGPCWPEGEKRCADIIGADLELLPLRGDRDEWRSPPTVFARKWRDGVDYTTHCSPETFGQFLKMTGHADLAEFL